MRAWVGMVGCSVVLLGACGQSSDDGAGGDPVTLVGQTEQGLRLRIDAVGEREVSVRFPANCGREGTATISLHRHRFEAGVADDGSFSVDEAYVEEGTDGDEEHVEVRIAGAFAEDGTASGTLEATARWWNGQGGDFGSDCETGTVAWTADQAPVEGEDLVVTLADLVRPEPAGTDLLVWSDAGEAHRIDAATGEARHMDGAPPAAPPATDPNAPPTTATGPAAVAGVGSMWLREVAVADDGVWMVDPASGLVSRFELADGTRTATIDAPLEDIAAGPDALWTVSTNAFRSGYALDKRDPRTGEVLASTPVERGEIAAGPTELWYVDATLAGGRLARVDPTTLALGEPFDVDIRRSTAEVVATADRVWWLDLPGLMSIELTGGQAGPVDLPSDPDAVAGDATGVWTTHEQEAVARRIEGDRVVRTVDIPDGWWDVAVTTDGAVWLSGRDEDSDRDGDRWRIIRLDPAVTAG